MSRCYPYPPPGYEKKAAQPPEIVLPMKKEKHKHRDKERDKDKEKKKKRKRDDNAKDESSHKDKRSSKHQKAAAAGNDVGVHPANGRQAEPAFVAAHRLLDSTQEPAQGLLQADKTHHLQEIGEQQIRQASASVLDRTGTGREAADRAGHSGSSATSTSYGRPPESSRVQPLVKKDRDKEVNGKIPVVKPSVDTGQLKQQQQQRQHHQQQRGPDGKLTDGDVKPIVRAAEAVAKVGSVQPAATVVAEKAEKVAKADKADKADKAEKRAEKEEKRSEKAEKEDKRSKLLELQPVNNMDEDDKLEWLFPNKRKEPAAAAAAAGNGEAGAGAGVVVWAEPVFMSSADIYALPYVVPY